MDCGVGLVWIRGSTGSGRCGDFYSKYKLKGYGKMLKEYEYMTCVASGYLCFLNGLLASSGRGNGLAMSVDDDSVDFAYCWNVAILGWVYWLSGV